MSWQTRTLAEVAPTPWRNGGGVTRELVAWPPGPAWAWRISVAEVASGGPFSRFDGVQRWLAILRGAGVRLAFPDRSIELTDDSAPLAFAGADPVDCQLPDGAVQDLNLMVRDATPGAPRASLMRRVAGHADFRIDSAGMVAIYNQGPVARVRVDGDTLALAAETLAWRSLPARARIEIAAPRAIWMEIRA